MVGLDPNVAAARQEFLTDCLPPYCEAFTKMLNHRILVGVYSDTKGCFEFNLDEKSVNADERIKTLVSATGRAVMLTDEARAVLNLPPVDGGDELVTPLNVVVGEKPSPQVMPPQDPNKPPQDGSYREDQGPTPIGSGNAGKALPAPLEGAQDASERLPQFSSRRAADIERQRRNIDVFQGVVQKHFNRLERSLTQKAADGLGPVEPRVRPRHQRRAPADGAGRGRRLHGQARQHPQLRHGPGPELSAGDGRRARRTAINDTIRQEIKQLGLDEAMARAPQHVASAGTSLGRELDGVDAGGGGAAVGDV